VKIIPPWFIVTVGLICLALWVGSFFAALLVPTYKADPAIGYGAMVVVSACFTAGTVQAVANRYKRIADAADEAEESEHANRS
jgi:hypothetical protein